MNKICHNKAYHPQSASMIFIVAVYQPQLYSTHVCVCVSVFVFVYSITQKIMVQST